MSFLADMSDDELIKLSLKGDQAAFACILGRYNSMIYAKARAKSRLCGCDIVDDLCQEASIGLLKAVQSYDSSKNVRFKTYAETCIDNILVSSVRSYVSHKNQPLNNYEEFSDSEILSSMISYGLTDDSLDPQEYLVDANAFDELLDELTKALSDLERKVLDYRIRGYSYEETANALGIGVKSVDNAMQRVRQKIKMLLN